LIKTILIVLCLLAAPLTPAFAQDDGLAESQTYDPTFTGSIKTPGESIREMQRASLTDKGFIRPDVVHVALVHYPYMSADQFGLQLSVPDMVSGCYDLTPLEYEAQFIDPYFLDIKVRQYRRVAPEGVNAYTQCDRKNKMATALMVLDRKDLKSRGTQQIRFSTETGRDNYKIILNDTQIELIPESMMVFKGQNMSGPLKDRVAHSFSGDTTVVLQVPMARPGEDLSNEIVNFALSQSLSMPESGQTTSWNSNGMATYYFTDTSGMMASRIGADGYAHVGTISALRPADGPNGRGEVPVPLGVFVTRPGTQL